MLYFILFLLVASAAQLAGSAISWFFVKRFSRNIRIITLAEISLMLIVSLMLIWEGFGITVFVLLSAMFGILSLAVLNRIIPCRDRTRTERISLLVMVSMCFHEFPEGLAFGSSYIISPALGITMAILIAVHNLPEGSIISIPFFLKRGFSSGLKAVSLTQLLYITGGLLGYFLSASVSQELQALMMTFAAGAMVYIIFEEFFYLKKAR